MPNARLLDLGAKDFNGSEVLRMLLILIIVLLLVFGTGGTVVAVKRYTRHPKSLPCPYCGKPLAAMSRTCPHCGSRFG